MKIENILLTSLGFSQSRGWVSACITGLRSETHVSSKHPLNSCFPHEYMHERCNVRNYTCAIVVFG